MALCRGRHQSPSGGARLSGGTGSRMECLAAVINELIILGDVHWGLTVSCIMFARTLCISGTRTCQASRV